jgi:hypothetical protein
VATQYVHHGERCPDEREMSSSTWAGAARTRADRNVRNPAFGGTPGLSFRDTPTLSICTTSARGMSRPYRAICLGQSREVAC